MSRGGDRARRASARLGWAPHWVWPLAVGAALLAVGVLVLDDYAAWSDAVYFQRHLAVATLDFAWGQDDALPSSHDRFYGAAFELLPLLVERIAGLEDTRPIYLTRHLMTHLFFIVGGFFGYLLAYRMTGSRLLGLFAMLIFLLHPRLYGHSFFNSKDIPFLSMFMIALYCIHWAVHKGTVGAFLVCGAVVGILVNLRIMGVMLLPAVLALRACDWHYAAGGAARRRVIGSGAAFALAAIAIYYISLPYLWADPVGRFGELLATLSRHPTQPYELFQGRYYNAAALPAHYIPVWMALTTPPALLGLVGIGIGAVVWRTIAAAVARAGAVLRNTELRFELLLVGLVALPITAVIVLGSVLYNDWRQLYYLWAPLCLLAAAGLRQAGAGISALTRHSALTALTRHSALTALTRHSALTALTRHSALIRHSGARRNPAWRGRVGLRQPVVIALAVVVLAVSAAPLLRLHPYQHLYFNLLVDRATPEYLKTQYEMDAYYAAKLEAIKYILARHPGTDTLRRWPEFRTQAVTLPAAQRRRFTNDPDAAAYYVLHSADEKVDPPGLPAVMHPPVIYARKVYNSTIVSVATPDLSAVAPAIADTYREIYRAAVGREPTQRAAFDIYYNETERTLTLIKENCQPDDLLPWRILRVYPVAASDLRDIDRRAGHITAYLFGVRWDGKCLMQATLPDYGIARIVVEGISDFLPDAYRAELRRQYAALRATAPIIRADFAVYAGAGELRYLKDDCRPEDTAAPFFLHLIPAAANDLPFHRREHGFDNRDFNWDARLFSGDAARGQAIAFDDKCMITVSLPDYTIAAIRTGQYLPGAGQVWSGEFQTDADPAAQAARYAARATGAPAAPGFFNIYHSAGALTYSRDDCAPADTAARFYLHLFPANVNDLPAEQRKHGFSNRDFDFGTAGGVRHDGRCLVSIPLPDYALARIHTGQYTTPGAGRLWSAEIPVAERPAP